MVTTAQCLVYAVCAAVITGCGATDGGASAGGSSSSCAAQLLFRGETYWGHGDGSREPKDGKVLGNGTMPGCDDGDGQASQSSGVRVVALPDVDPSNAVLTSFGIWIADGAKLPDVIRDSRQPVRCSWPQPRQLSGTWLSVVGARPQYDGDLNTPYRIGLIVDGADVGLPRWRSVTVQIHVVAATDPTLRTSDVKQALWNPGTLTAQTHCDAGDFIADSATTRPQ